MGLTVVTPPAEEPVTVSECRQHSQFDDTAEDALIAEYIRAAREYVETFTGRQLITATYRLTLDEFSGRDEWFPNGGIVLPRPPLQSVTSVQYVDQDGVTQTVASSAYVVLADELPGRVELATGEVWPVSRRQTNACRITYVAGYGGASLVPSSLKQAIRMLVTHWHTHRPAVMAEALHDVPMAVNSLLWSNRVVPLP